MKIQSFPYHATKQNPNFGKLILETKQLGKTHSGRWVLSEISVHTQQDQQAKDWPPGLLQKIINNKELQKVVSEYAAAGIDVYATYNKYGCGSLNKISSYNYHHPSSELRITAGYGLGRESERKIITYFSLNNSKHFAEELDKFKAEDYVQKPRTLRYLNSFNDAMQKITTTFSQQSREIIKNLKV